MNILKSYADGFKRTYTLKKIVTIIFGITVSLGVILAFAFFSATSEKFGARPEVLSLLKDFNATVYFDLMNNYKDLIEPFTGMMIWFGLIYFFFSVFFAGGVIKMFEGSSIQSAAQAFFAGSVKYFFRFLRLGFFVLIAQFLAFIVIAAGFLVIFTQTLQNSTEPKLFTIIMMWLATHFLVWAFISVVADYAKIILVKEDSKKVFKSLWYSFSFSVRKVYVTYPLYLLCLIVPIVSFVLYFLLEDLIGMKSGFTVLIMFLIQQVFIWCRLFAKVWILASEYNLFTYHLLIKGQPIITQEMLINESV
jgi:hypothetical protein